jgi:hypothetical protein
MRCTQKQTKTYIAEQAAELAKLAAGARLWDLERLLELATLEARKGVAPEPRPQRTATASLGAGG